MVGCFTKHPSMRKTGWLPGTEKAVSSLRFQQAMSPVISRGKKQLHVYRGVNEFLWPSYSFYKVIYMCYNSSIYNDRLGAQLETVFVFVALMVGHNIDCAHLDLDPNKNSQRPISRLRYRPNSQQPKSVEEGGKWHRGKIGGSDRNTRD